MFSTLFCSGNKSKDTMWPRTVTFSAACLWLLTITNLESGSTAIEATNDDIRTAILSIARSLRDNGDKLERHERREKQSGEQVQNTLLTIVNKQREQFVDDKNLEAIVKNLEQTVNALTKVETQEAESRADTHSMLDNLDKHLTAGEAEFKSLLKAEKQTTNSLYQSLDEKLSVLTEQVVALQTRIETAERAPKSTATNDAIYELLQQLAADRSARTGGGGGDVDDAESAAAATAAANNATSQLVQETRHAVVEAVKSLSDRLDESERLREASEARAAETEAAAAAFRDDARNGFRSVLERMETLTDVEKVLVQTADNVLDAKRRIEYSTHQILMELTTVVNDRSRELNESANASLERAVQTVLGAQSMGTANVSVKVETEISQVWRQIGVMYQTLTDSAAALATLQRQTDAFVNGTVASVDGMNNKVTAIAGRMTEVDDNLNYLLGRLSLVTQEFKEIKVGLGEALESIRIGLQTVQGGGDKPTVDLGPGPNPIDDEPLPENINQSALSKTVYTVA